jgi:hypothetical protein
MEDVIQFQSKDFYLSAVCMAVGCKLVGLDRSPGDFVEFVFQESPETCHEIISAHWADELQVSSKKLVEAINELKTRLHGGR